MTAAKAFALEAEALVQADCRLVVRKDMQLELGHANAARPLHGLLEQRPADSEPAVRLRHHQAKVGHVRARGMRVARQRKPADDSSVPGLGDEDRRVRRTADRPQVAPLVGDAARPSRGEQPALGLSRYLAREGDKRRCVRRRRRPDRELAHSTTMPRPPRRGSPAAASVPSARHSTPAAPPK